VLKPVNRHKLHEEITHQIETKILNGEFPPGHRLPAERDLAEEFTVNRSTVREGLKKLEALGLLSILHGDGIYVRDYREAGNLELLKSLFLTPGPRLFALLDGLLEIRTTIVPPMAGHAARNRNEEELGELENAVNNDTLSLQEKDLLIHRIIARSSGNMAFIFILNYFNDIFRRFGHLYFEDNENRELTIRFHRDILTAIREKNSLLAEKIMKEVLITTWKNIMKHVQRGTDYETLS